MYLVPQARVKREVRLGTAYAAYSHMEISAVAFGRKLAAWRERFEGAKSIRCPDLSAMPTI